MQIGTILLWNMNNAKLCDNISFKVCNLLFEINAIIDRKK